MPVLTACNGNEGSRITAYIGDGVSVLDPIRCTEKEGQTYIANLFSGLYSYSVGEDGHAELVCEDAESLPYVYELGDGRVRLKFKLKDGLTWSNGEDLTPEDYVYSWNRAAEYSLYNDKGYIFSLVDGYDTYVSYEENASLNMTFNNEERTFSVVLTGNTDAFLQYTTETYMFPVSRIAVRDSKNWNNDPEDFASNGRFTLKELSKTRIVMVKNERYRDAEHTTLEEIEFTFDTEKAEKMVVRENIAAALVSIDSAAISHTNKSVRVGVTYMAFNVSDTSLALFSEEEKVKIRRAISIYVSNAGIFDDEYGVPELVPSLKTNSDLDMSEEYADSLMKEVAESSGRFTYQDGEVYEFPFMHAICAGRSGELKKWDRIADALSKQGINVLVKNCSWEDFLKARINGEYSMLINTWVNTSLCEAEFLRLFTSDSQYNDALLGSVNTAWKEEYDVYIYHTIGEPYVHTGDYEKALGALIGSAALVPLENVCTEWLITRDDVASVYCDGLLRFK